MAKAQLNWDPVTWNNTTIGSISNVSIDPGAQVQTLSAGNDRFPTLAVNTMNRPKVSVESSDTAALMGLVPGTSATFTARHRSANSSPSNTNNQNGDITYTMVNAVVENPQTGGGHNSWGTASVTLVGLSSDGYTNPLSFVKT